MNRRLRQEDGFTLVELMIAIGIVGSLLMLALPAFLNQGDKAKTASAKSSLTAAVHSAKAMWKSNDDTLPGTNPATFAAKLAAAEPTLNIVSSAGYTANQISVWRDNNDTATFRTLSANGESLAWKAYFAQDNLSQKVLGTGALTTRTNYEPNPRFAVDEAKWTHWLGASCTDLGSGRTAMPDAAGTYGYHAYGRNANTTTLTAVVGATRAAPQSKEPLPASYTVATPGQTWTVSADTYTISASATDWFRLMIIWHKADGTEISSSSNGNGTSAYTLKPGTSQHFSFTTSTAPANTAYLETRVQFLSTTPLSTINAYVTNIMLEQGNTAHSYIDGDFPDGVWQGTSHQSQSTAPAWPTSW